MITGHGLTTREELAEPRTAALLRGERTRALAPETLMALTAARLALRDAGLADGALAPSELGVAVATCHAGLQDYVELFQTGVGGERPIRAAQGPQTGLNAPAAHLSIRLRAAGPNATFANGPVGGLDALRFAAGALAGGRARAMLVCGVDARPALLGASDGGDAAAVVVLEQADTARSRGASTRAVVRGVGTALSPSGDLGDARRRALEEALRDAALAREAVELAPAPDGESVAGAVERLAAAASALRRRGVRAAPVAVRASDGQCAAGVAVLGGCEERAA